MSAEPDDAWSLRACPSCAAVITQPLERISHACSYCGSALVEAARAAVAIDRVAPFRLSAAAAEERLRQHLAARWWAPERLRRAASRGGSLRNLDARLVEGVLVPFYAYDATCRSRYETRVGLYWYEKKKTSGRGGKRLEWPPIPKKASGRGGKRLEWPPIPSKGTSRGRASSARSEPTHEVVRHTEWFPLKGTAVCQLRDHLVSASVGLSAAEVGALSPFDLGRTRPFDPRLMAGWPAELPSRGRSEADHDATEQIRARELRRIGQEQLPGDTHRDTRVSCQVELAEAELVLLPVWVAVLRYGGKIHRLVVNGQTGRCHGSAPVSPVKVVIAVTFAVVIAAVLAWRLS